MRRTYRQRDPALLDFLLLGIVERAGEYLIELCDRRARKGIWVA